MTQEQIEALQASESIKHANLHELARLVLEMNEASKPFAEMITEETEEHSRYSDAYWKMINFAKGVAQ